MMHSAWKKEQKRHNRALGGNQLRGACIILAIALVMYCTGSGLSHSRSPRISVPYVEPKEGDTIVVELAGDTPGRGIYYVSGSPTVGDLLTAVEVEKTFFDIGGDCNVSVKDGDRVVVHSRAGSIRRITIDRIGNGTRYVLDMPIDINRATIDDLMLLPGIGRVTAQKIIGFRDKEGPVSSINDLKIIRNLNGHRLDAVRSYFYVGKP